MPKPSKFRPLKPFYKQLFRLYRTRAHGSSIQFSGRSDGAGAQVHSQFSIAAYAHLRGMQWIPQPLRNVAHNENSAADWDEQWNLFFNFPTEAAEEPSCQHIPKIQKLLRLRPNHHYSALKAHAIVDLFPESYQAVMPAIRAAYDESSFHKHSLFTGSGLKVAIHLRRGDVQQMSGRRSSIEASARKLAAVLPQLRKAHSQIEVLVLSQGDEKDFQPMLELGAKLALDADVFHSFHSMVVADVLITARSSFSYAAALLNQGQVLYEPFWHPALPEWRAIQQAAFQ